MRFAFILTAGNGTPAPDRALSSLPACVRPGDEVIVVDAGSDDGTAERIEEALVLVDFGPGVVVKPVLLGVEPPFWPALAANTGLREANAEALVLLEDGAWLDEAAFNRARAIFEAGGADLMIARSHGQQDEIREQPAPGDPDAAAIRLGSIAMTAATARLIFSPSLLPLDRRGFAETGALQRDGFVWDLLTRAKHPVVCTECISHLARERMDDDPMSVFARHEALLATGAEHESMALGWLVGRMARDIPRIAPQRRVTYAGAMARALARHSDAVWQAGCARIPDPEITCIAEALRRGEIVAVATLWTQQETLRLVSALSERIGRTEARLDDLAASAAATGQRVESLCRIAEFAAISQLADAEDALESLSARASGGGEEAAAHPERQTAARAAKAGEREGNAPA